MSLRPLPSVVFVAALASACMPAAIAGPSLASKASVAFSVIVPVVITSLLSPQSQILDTSGKFAPRWTVSAVRPEGDKTALELDSDDKTLKMAMSIDRAIVQREQLAVGDSIVVEEVGTTGYAARKGAATIALFARPGMNMAHSRARA